MFYIRVKFPLNKRKISKEYQKFFSQILDKDPSKRATAKQLLNHLWINMVDIEK